VADHFVSLATRGLEGFKDSDFTVGTATVATDVIELRVLDGASLSKLDVIKALEAFERFFNDPKQVAAAGFDVSG
jgi:hypothetical protein